MDRGRARGKGTELLGYEIVLLKTETSELVIDILSLFRDTIGVKTNIEIGEVTQHDSHEACSRVFFLTVSLSWALLPY